MDSAIFFNKVKAHNWLIWRCFFLNAKNPLFNRSTFSPFWLVSMIREIGIRSTSFSRQVSVWPVHENVISPRCDQFKNNQLPHWGEASVRWGKIQPLLMTFSGEHAPKISNRFLIITILGIIIVIISAVIIAIIVILIRIRTCFSFLTCIFIPTCISSTIISVPMVASRF